MMPFQPEIPWLAIPVAVPLPVKIDKFSRTLFTRLERWQQLACRKQFGANETELGADSTGRSKVLGTHRKVCKDIA